MTNNKRYSSHFTFHVSRFTFHVSRFTRHVSRFTPHAARTFNLQPSTFNLVALLLLVLSFASPARAGRLIEVDILPTSGQTLARYSPIILWVDAGDTVRWTNRDGEDLHNIIFDSLDKFGEELSLGESDFVTFEQPGTYRYICGPHPYMTGTIVVGSPPVRLFIPGAFDRR